MLKSKSNYFSVNQFKSVLVETGFSLNPGSEGDTSNPIRTAFDDQWIELISNLSPNISDPLDALIGRPGLWKLVTDRDDQLWKIFELPNAIVTENHPDCETLFEEATSPFPAVLQWAKDTINGQQPLGWRCPSKRSIRELYSDGSLTVHCGPFARQGELVCTAKRLALRFPLIIHLSDDLPKSSYDWLRTLLIDAQNRWRLVRIGLRSASTVPSVQAEVDLTGAPRSVLPGLMTVALSALHALATWVIPAAEFLVAQTTDLWALAEHNQVGSPMKMKGGD